MFRQLLLDSTLSMLFRTNIHGEDHKKKGEELETNYVNT